MTPTPAPTIHRLRRNRVLRLPHPHGWCLRAERGTLWITIDGRPEDITLDPGQSHRFDARTPVLVTALGDDAVLSAVAPAAVSRWHGRLLMLFTRPGLQAA